MNMNKTGMGNRTETGNIHSLYFSPFFFLDCTIDLDLESCHRRPWLLESSSERFQAWRQMEGLWL